MEEKTFTIEIPQDICTMIQKYDVERSSRKDIITYILSHDDINVSEEKFQKYQQEYDEKFFCFEVAKSELEKNYIIPLTKGKKCNWSLNYSDSIITVTLQE